MPMADTRQRDWGAFWGAFAIGLAITVGPIVTATALLLFIMAILTVVL